MFDLTEEKDNKKLKKVLIVDADKANIYATQLLLSKWGFITDSVENGVKCLDYLKTHKDVDIILMDHVMREMDGEECLKYLRSNTQTNNIPVLMHTATALKGSRSRFINAGANDYISKPINFSEMRSKITKLAFSSEVNEARKVSYA